MSTISEISKFVCDTCGKHFNVDKSVFPILKGNIFGFAISSSGWKITELPKGEKHFCRYCVIGLQSAFKDTMVLEELEEEIK